MLQNDLLDKLGMETPNLLPHLWSLTTSPTRQQHTYPGGAAALEVTDRTHELDLQPARQGTMLLKRENAYESKQEPKRAKHTQDSTHTKRAPGDAVETYLYDDSGHSLRNTDLEEGEIDTALIDISILQPRLVPISFVATCAAPVPPVVALLPTLPSPGNSNESGAEFITKKMFKFSNFTERTNECHTELERIATELGLLEGQAPLLVSGGNTKWLVLRVATLAEERLAVRTVIERTRKNGLSKRRRADRQRKEAKGTGCQLEEKRPSNQIKIKAEGGDLVEHVDLTDESSFVEINQIVRPGDSEALKTVEDQSIARQEVPDEVLDKVPMIKVEPMIKIDDN